MQHNGGPEQLNGIGVAATVYYWPEVNGGLGHVACTLQEVGEQNRWLFVSSFYVGGERAISEYTVSRSESLYPYVGYDLQIFKSPSVVKITLPPVSHLDFTQLTAELNEMTADFHYNIFDNNCAHLTQQILTKIYGHNLSARRQWGLRPSQIASGACKFLDEHHQKNVGYYRSLLDQTIINSNPEIDDPAIQHISSIEFAQGMLPHMIEGIQKIFEDGMLIQTGESNSKTELRSAFDHFSAWVKDPHSENHLAIIQDLTTKLEHYSQQLHEVYRNQFGTLTLLLYGLIRIFWPDQRLDALLNFDEIAKSLQQGIKDTSLINSSTHHSQG